MKDKKPKYAVRAEKIEKMIMENGMYDQERGPVKSIEEIVRNFVSCYNIYNTKEAIIHIIKRPKKKDKKYFYTIYLPTKKK